jgi:hypothetical protein
VKSRLVGATGRKAPAVTTAVCLCFFTGSSRLRSPCYASSQSASPGTSSHDLAVIRQSGYVFTMSNAPSSTAIDPILAAIENAPMADRPQSEGERLAMEEARAHAAAGGRWFPGDEVSAAIEARRLKELLEK